MPMHFIKARFDRTLGEMPEKMQRLFNEMIRLGCNTSFISDSPFGWAPEADLYETDHELVLTVNLAGVRKEDIEVSFHGNSLRVSGRRSSAYHEERPNRFILLEMGAGDFERTFRLPLRIDDNAIEAIFSDGLLTVRMKRQRKPSATQVEIRE